MRRSSRWIISPKIFISPYYLSHQFKSVTGFTLINYIQMTRVRNASSFCCTRI